MKTFILVMAAAMCLDCTNAQTPQYTAKVKKLQTTTTHIHNATSTSQTIISQTDTQKAVSIINKFARTKLPKSDLIISIARELKGVPYVAKTLENDTTENLVVNLRELDCTTYVENVLAIYLCIKERKSTIADFCNYLRRIRYVNGIVAYPARQHYFTEWISENTKDGFVKETNSPNPPFSARQKLNIDFMSTHTALYPMLRNNPDMTTRIAAMEKRLSGKTFPYIPKSGINNTKLLRSTIHDGDIIAITTSKKGLDTSHIGIAVWHKDGLHMLNASQIHKKVVEESMTLRQYMQKHPSQTGIRIVQIL